MNKNNFFKLTSSVVLSLAGYQYVMGTSRNIFCENQKPDLIKKEHLKNLPNNRRELYEQFVNQWQQDFVEMVQSFEKKEQFLDDKWNRDDKRGYGRSCVLQDGQTIEKGGVNTTLLTIPFSKGLAQSLLERGAMYNEQQIKNMDAYANGCSIVIHPKNPMAPTTHGNFRYFEIIEKNTGEVLDYWFGGGVDLTPIYLFEEDCVLFHKYQKQACDKFDKSLYKQLKDAADKYFVIKHRNECRGIGGTFFNDIVVDNDWQKSLDFQKECAYKFLESYKEILKKRVDQKYNEQNVEWQQVRRGRYVEFNLIYDKGTSFGLHTPNARIESILMSLPLHSQWRYRYEAPGAEEQKLIDVLKNPKDWI